MNQYDYQSSTKNEMADTLKADFFLQIKNGEGEEGRLIYMIPLQSLVFTIPNLLMFSSCEQNLD